MKTAKQTAKKTFKTDKMAPLAEVQAGWLNLLRHNLSNLETRAHKANVHLNIVDPAELGDLLSEMEICLALARKNLKKCVQFNALPRL